MRRPVVTWLGFLLCFPLVLHAQPAVERQQAFVDVGCNFVVMNVSAHPDDEDGAALALYRMKYGAKTYSILFTRGEGGQNEKGPELYEALGVLRSAETRSAGRILGTEVHFLNLQDFGFSKTATEAFQKWGGQREVLRRLVHAIREYKPDVIFTNHNTIDGHGHHQAVAITAIAAFDAAADSSWFPEQLREPHLALWQPKKLYFRQFGRSETTYDVANAIDDVDSARGIAYLDIASQALRQHKTQGMERADLRAFTRGKSLYKLMRSNSPYERDTTTFFGGMDLWRDPALDALSPTYAAMCRLRPAMPRDSILTISSRLLASLQTVRTQHHLVPLADRIVTQWQNSLERLVEAVGGVRSSFRLVDTVVIPRQTVRAVFTLASDSAVLGTVRPSIALPEGWSVSDDGSRAPEFDAHHFSKSFLVTVGEKAVRTIPREVEQYASLDDPERLTARCEYTLNGIPAHETVAADYDVAPPQLLRVSPHVVHLDPTHPADSLAIVWTVTNFFPRSSSGTLHVELPAGWRAESFAYKIPQEDSAVTGTVHVYPPAGVAPGDYSLTVKAEYWSERVTVRAFDVVKDPKIFVGVIRSYDTTLEESMKELGLRYATLSDDDLASADLSKFTSIIVDIRAYLVREGLRKNNARLLEYVKRGGNLIVMYQRDQEWKPEYAPYPFTITRKRVTVEEAPVTILEPAHPLFHTPNVIDPATWLGWKQERAVYMPGDVAPQYHQLLSSHDPDEEPLTTGLLVGSSGGGSYIYTSYVWYRQLKEDIPGAYRILLNMIAYPLHRGARP